ncbi:hypothetical protein BGX27_010219 [Mortierella sp. AM989]|nr:hypothetical protein BGX27_010219 [Mortierella sp. AM989]
MALFNNKSRSLFKKPLPNNPSPLFIPEILEIIFSFLSPRLLQLHSSLVCRQWYLVVKSLLSILLPINWTGNPRQSDAYQQSFLHNLAIARALVIQRPKEPEIFYYSGVPHEGSKPWFDLITRLGNLATENRLQLNELHVLQSILLHTQLLPLIDVAGSVLTSLKLENVGYIDVPLDRILVTCPRLHTLHVRHTRKGYYQSVFHHGPGSEYGRPALPTSLPLRSLTLEAMGVEKAALLNLLASCPDLKELQLIKLIGPVYVPHPIIVPPRQDLVIYFRDWILEQIAAYCPKLRKIHLSICQESSWDVHGLALFSRVTDWSFLWRDATPVILKSLRRSHSSTLTSLEIVGVALHEAGYTPNLHRFMCESPQLLHLKAPEVRFETVWFDLEGILNSSGLHHRKYNNPWHPGLVGKSIDPAHRKIWACRNLRTLHLTFFYGSRDCNSVESMRVMFGYLGKVCPRLQDLSINCRMLALNLDSGFCLLSKLHELRRFRIITDIRQLNGPWDIGWVLKYLTPALRASMKLWIAKYNFTKSDLIYAKTPFASSNDVRPLTRLDYQRERNNDFMNVWDDDSDYGADGGDDGDDDIDKSIEADEGKGSPRSILDYMIEGVDMRNLGRRKDILDLFKDRLDKSWPCWPRMEYFEIATDYHHHIYDVRKMRGAIRKLRPDIDVK